MNIKDKVNALIEQNDDYSNRLDQINCLAKALSSMVGYNAPKEWIVLVEMICQKAEV